MHAPPRQAQPRGGHLRRLRLRSLILLVVLVPTLGMVTGAGILSGEALTTRDTARRVDDRVATLASLAEARVVLVNERTTSGLMVFGAELGVDEDMLRELTGTDHRAELLVSRTAVDTSATLRSLPEMSEHRQGLEAARDSLDEGTASSAQVRSAFDRLTAGVDREWNDEFAELQDDLRSGNLTGSLQDRATALREAFAAQRWGMSQGSLAMELIQTEPGPRPALRFLAAGTRYRAAIESLEAVLGTAAREVWDDRLSDPAVERFVGDLGAVEETLLTGEAVSIGSPDDFQQSLNDAGIWSAGLGELVQAAAQDLRTESALQEHAAANTLRIRIAVTGALTFLSLTGAVLLTRSVARPVRRLEDAASQIRAGQFEIETIDPSGPRELSDTALAFNEMTITLASVETYATTLADEPEDPLLDHPIPGRTGQALQVALNRLRASIRQSEQRREALEVVATHDSLTDLLNRSAAFMMVARDLATAARSDGVVTALFIDLDEFKLINDRYGHAAGDDALHLVADALRESTRKSDVVARIGGDEFLVAGAIANGPGEAERLAERIRDAVRSIWLGTPDGPIGLHCSIGVALSRPGDDVDQLVQRADTAMYAAKQEGRDGIAWAGISGAESSS